LTPASVRVTVSDVGLTRFIKRPCVKYFDLRWTTGPYSGVPLRTPDPYSEWFLSRGNEPNSADKKLLAAAREAWPRALAHARWRLSGKYFGPDETAFTVDVWQKVLQSVARALERRTSQSFPVADLPSYLIGAFHHRFNRALKKEQKRAETIEFVSSIEELEGVPTTATAMPAVELERAITIAEIVGRMDKWTRQVWWARKFGYSWKDIAKHLGHTEAQVQMKFRYGLKKTRERLFGSSGRNTNPGSRDD
jgi:DNA-directed RNA polymerase specialized sigma24 family protein